METIRIFISSPGDVAEERERARQVVQGLRRRYARHFDVVPVVWEDMPLGLDASFQEGIDMLLSRERGIDIAVFILWSRLGSALGAKHSRPDGREYRSGTERELEMMLEARAAQGGVRPHILAYTRDDEATFEESLRGRSTAEKEECIRQKRLVEGFIREQFHDTRTGMNLRAYHTYQRPQTFGERLRVHLQEILDGLSAGRTGRPAWDIEHRGPPFLGLESFSFAHAEVFFGREDEVTEGRLRLAAAARRGIAFLLVSGSSGSGKSSLAAAGILPEIVAHETDDQVGRWLHAAFTPATLAGDPAAGTARILMETVPSLAGRVEAGDLAAALRDGTAAAVRLAILPALKSEARGSGAVRLVLLVDQLEELFTDPRLDDASRQLFAEILTALATSGHVWVVATVRGDFHERLLGCDGLRRLKSEGGQLDLGPPTADALRRMIESPAILSGLAYEQTGDTTLADRILRDVSGQAELLPLLEDLLRALFEARTADGVLGVDAYESLGGIAGALSRRAESSLASLPPDVQRAFPDVLRRLVAVGESGEAGGVRRRVPHDSFVAGSAGRAVVDQLVVDRLATASAGSDGVPQVAIAHEAILRLWPRAAAWIAENAEFLRLRDRLAVRMREESPLNAADPLVPAARAILESRAALFEPDLAAYVRSQLRTIDEERRRKVRWRRIGAAATTVALAAVAIGGVAMYDRAERQKRLARAEGAVEGLLRADGSQITAAAAAATDLAIVGESALLLREAFAAAKTPSEKMRAAIGLAKLQDATDDVGAFLAESLLKAEPGEIESIRAALRPWAGRFRDMLWGRAEGGAGRGERLRAAAALAAYDPQDERWWRIAPVVAADLVVEPTVHLSNWLAALRDVRG